jgi:hypothetical protein
MMSYIEVAFALLVIVAIAALVWFVILSLAIGFRLAAVTVGGLYRMWRKKRQRHVAEEK